MSEFIRNFLVNKQANKEETIKLNQLNEKRFAEQIKMSSYIPRIKVLFLSFCIFMTICMPIAVKLGWLEMAQFAVSQEKFSWSGFILANFMHFSFVHLAMNMFAMIFLFNRFFFANYKILLMAMTFSMIGSSALSVMFVQEKGFVIGSSGILFGLFAFYMLYLLDIMIKYKGEGFNVGRIKRFLLIQFVLCVIINFLPMIAWYAHLGGAIMGTVCYYMVRKNLDFSYESFVLTYYKI